MPYKDGKYYPVLNNESTAVRAPGAAQGTKPNYCQHDVMSKCTVKKHDGKKMEDCRYFKPKKNSTELCIHYRTDEWLEGHCDNWEAQNGK